MFCIKCGRENADNEAFCQYCGAPLYDDNPRTADEYRRRFGTEPVLSEDIGTDEVSGYDAIMAELDDEPDQIGGIAGAGAYVARNARTDRTERMDRSRMVQGDADDPDFIDESRPYIYMPPESHRRGGDPNRSIAFKVFVVLAVIIGILLVVLAVRFVVGLGKSDETTETPTAASTQTTSTMTDTSANTQTTTTTTNSATTTPTYPVQTEPPVFTGAEASSELQADDDAYYGAKNVLDGDPTTAWNEGDSGDGTGQWIRLSADTDQVVVGIHIMGGYDASKDIYDWNNRPKDITIAFDDGTSFDVTLSDSYNVMQDITFEHPVQCKTITITVNTIYGGSQYQDMCISEIEPY